MSAFTSRTDRFATRIIQHREQNTRTTAHRVQNQKFSGWPLPRDQEPLDGHSLPRGQALANCLLLQFSADGARHAFYVTSSDWLNAAEVAGVRGKQ
jgi:hypothetical protein